MDDRTGAVFVSDHVFWLIDAGQTLTATFTPDNGLVVAPQEGIGLVFTGINTGFVTVMIAARSSRPDAVDQEGWDEIVEVSLEAPRGQMRATGLMADNQGGPLDLTPHGPGPYRVRVHAAGRDTNIDGVAMEPVETYLILTWPQPAGPDLAYKQTDRYGASLRNASSPHRHPN